MILRLWWKEARLFQPVWIFLALVGAGCQWLALRYLKQDARTGLLPLMAGGWTCLYAFAVGSASFAGERETRTLGFLDTLPVPRGVLWRGKVSFAIVSTLALAGVLVALSQLGTDRWEAPRNNSTAMLTLGGVVILLEVLGWGLFMSSITSNAPTAAVLAICGVSLFTPLLTSAFGSYGSDPYDLVSSIPTRLATALGTIALSGLAVTWRGFRKRADAVERRPRRRLVIRLEGEGGASVASEVRGLSPWWPAARAIGWQTMREGSLVGRTIFALVIVAMVISFIPKKSMQESDLAIWSFCLFLLPGLIAGVSILGQEHRGRTHHFLAHHGARPGQVWLVKNVLWALGLALLWAPLGWVWVHNTLGGYFNLSHVLMTAALLATPVAIGELCGMTMRRGLTAVVVGFVITMAVMIPALGLALSGMISAGVMALVPISLLLVSRAWAGDWLLARPGLGRWARLGVLLVVAGGSVFGIYVADRAWNVPTISADQERQFLAFSAPATPAPHENAALLYSEALNRLVGAGSIANELRMQIQMGLALSKDEASEIPNVVWLKKNQKVLAMVREASVRPRCESMPLDRITLINPDNLPSLSPLSGLVTHSIQDQYLRGDLEGAWNDLLVLFRMARQRSGYVSLFETTDSLIIEREALGLAMQWAADEKQTPESLKKALEEYQALPAMPGVQESLKAQARIVEQTLKLPRQTLIDWSEGMESEGRRNAPFWQHFAIEAIASPWEISRAQRTSRLYFATHSELASLEPFQRRLLGPKSVGGLPQPVGQGPSPAPVGTTEQNFEPEPLSPLLKFLVPNLEGPIKLDDYNLVSRRALEWILALRGWQVRHGGKLPEELMSPEVQEALGPLPNDPYSGHSFGYVMSNGQLVRPIGMLNLNAQNVPLSPSVGERLLSSVGPDRVGDKGEIASYYGKTDDIIFRLNQPKRKKPDLPAEKKMNEAEQPPPDETLPGFLQEIK